MRVREARRWQARKHSLKEKLPAARQSVSMDCSVPIQELNGAAIVLVDPETQPTQPQSCLAPATRFRSPKAPAHISDIVDTHRSLRRGLKQTTHVQMHRIFENSFTTKDVIDFLCATRGCNLKQAVSMGKKLERHKLIHHVSLRSTVSNDEDSLFQFHPPDNHQRLFWMQGIDLEDCSMLPPSAFRLAAYLPNLVIRNLWAQRGIVKYPYFETIDAAVLFADISGYTALTESLVSRGVSGIEKLTKYLNDYFSRMISIIYSYGGDVVKFAGDALVVIWPTSGTAGLGYSAHIACQCALSLVQDLGDFDAGGPTLSLHIGISCGALNCMLIVTVKRAELLPLGTPLQVSTTSESLARPGSVVLPFTVTSAIASHTLKVHTVCPQPVCP
eukprot:TRINITY_DN12451_c0_g1_i1.p1 TRINITY_DN12451_c0_g1~~TRINITY_DN12451_c0_g1_i1.p1  ORF type:complete len:387 (+),score=25.08 TRINITY_DN12451_c0_g1_i1:30-1190(+)